MGQEHWISVYASGEHSKFRDDSKDALVLLLCTLNGCKQMDGATLC